MISRTDGRTCRSNGRARMITAILTTFAGVLLSPVGALAAPSAPASAPQQATWSIERTPNPRVANGTLLAISCPTAHDCVGVGSYDDAQATSPWAEIWNGKSWKAVPAASPNGSTHTVLAGISCATSSFCMAVGHSTDVSGVQVTLAETWNGKSWALRSPPNPPSAKTSQLVAVSCASPQSCVAVGTYTLSHDVYEGISDLWDGSTWTSMKIAHLPSAGTMFGDVSCFTVRDCVAVGMYLNSNTDDWETLAELWQGSGWQAQQTPQATGSIVDDLQGVSCISQSECTAVGYYINGNGVGNSLGATLAEAWNGSAWTIQPTPNPKGLNLADLESVSCTSATACTAVGSFDRNGVNDIALAEVWNGSEWTLQPTVNPKTATSLMSGVACPVQSECIAAGSSEAKFGPSVPLLEVRGDTSWKQVQVPVLDGTASSILQSVSCGSTTACMAVGSFKVSPSTTATLSEDWNGTKWRIVPMPIVKGSGTSTLESVVCTSPDACVAVGSETSGTSSAGLVESWNGKRWTIEQISTPPGTSSVLSAVSCTSVEYCVAAGYYVLDSESFAFTEIWNGSVWSIDTVPLPPEGYDSELEAVSCTSPTACTAVGQYTQSAMLAALVERWNGSQWVLQSTPAIDGYLVGVSCPTVTACTAVGSSYSYPAGIAVLAEAWNGTKWKIETTPPIADTDFAQFYGAECQVPTSCTAVGAYSDAESGRSVSLAESSQASKWASDATPNPQGPCALVAVSARSPSTLVAVGSQAVAGGVSLTFAEAATVHP